MVQKKCFAWVLILLTLLVLLSPLFQAFSATSNQTKQPGHCVWYGQCHRNERGYQYCPYNGTAKPLGAEGIAVLKEWCPQFLDTLDATHATCCDVDQLKTLDKNIKLAANFLKRCPSCMNNLAKHLCHFTCSPVQSDFFNATIKTGTQDNKTVEFVDGIDLYIRTDYLEGKCKNTGFFFFSNKTKCLQ